MIKWLIKSTNEIRIETKSEVEEFHAYIQEKAESLHCRLTSWQEVEKQKKAQGEIIEEFYIVKYTLTFNEAKDPETPLRSIEYNLFNQE